MQSSLSAVQSVCGPVVPWSICQVSSILSIFSDIVKINYKNVFCCLKTDIIEMIIEIESIKLKRTKMKTDSKNEN